MANLSEKEKRFYRLWLENIKAQIDGDETPPRIRPMITRMAPLRLFFWRYRRNTSHNRDMAMEFIEPVRQKLNEVTALINEKLQEIEDEKK